MSETLNKVFSMWIEFAGLLRCSEVIVQIYVTVAHSLLNGDINVVYEGWTSVEAELQPVRHACLTCLVVPAHLGTASSYLSSKFQLT
jgi:hypothetical protein